jgi:hypothetical protein
MSTNLTGTTFAVDEVQIADSPLWTEPLWRSLIRRFSRSVQLVPEWDKPVINSVVDRLPLSFRGRDLDAVGTRTHALVDAVHTAFSRHHPLTLSPDAVWMTIAQGFSHHIAENAAALRHRMVRHEGRQELTARIAALNMPELERAIGDFSLQIRNATDPVLHETLLCDFSTTTPAVRAASEIVLMDAYSSYFRYEMRCICGIPRITLTGRTEDWQRIRDRIEVLATFDLEWWVSRLRPILDEFVQSASGGPDTRFWRAICKPQAVYATTNITGWLADLFPYLGDPPDRDRNHALAVERRDWCIPVSHGVSTESFPSGLCSVPVKLTMTDGPVRNLDFVAGFFAVEQARDTRSLSPVVSWSVAERPPREPVLV